MTGLLLSNLCKNIVKKLVWKFIDIFLNQVLNFLNIFTGHGKIIADYRTEQNRTELYFKSILGPYADGIGEKYK